MPAPPKWQAEHPVRNQESFNHFWKTSSSFFSQCPVLNKQGLTIFSWLFPCPLRRFGCWNITQVLISFSISAPVLQRSSWCCCLDMVIFLLMLVLLVLRKLRKWLLAFSVLAVTWCKHLPVTTIASSIACSLCLYCSRWLNFSLFGLIFERERENTSLLFSWYRSEPSCLLLTQMLFSACQQTHATLWAV